MTVHTDYFTSATQSDFFRLFCGDFLGSGVAREVYAHDHDPTKVIKFETKYKSFQNIMEWDIWEWVKDGPLQRWFAPCYHISGNGIVLIQARTERLPDRYKLPTHLPALLGDIKLENFGLLNGKLVAHDYGLSNAVLQNITKVQDNAAKLVRCEWGRIAKPDSA